MYKWFVDNKLPIQFGEDKSKCILSSKKKTGWNLTCDNNIIKQINRIKQFYIVQVRTSTTL